MPKKIGTVGSGITRRGVISFDWYVPGDADLQVQAAIEAYRRMSFHLTSRQLGNLAGAILAAAGLPSDPNQLYTLTEAEGWKALENANDTDGLLLPELVQALGREPDSPEGYAARLISVLFAIDNHSKAGELDEALALAMFAGALASEAGMKAIWEPDALAGEKVREGGRAAHARRYGTPEERVERDQELALAFDAALATGLNKMVAYQTVARRHRVGQRTVERAAKRFSRT